MEANEVMPGSRNGRHLRHENRHLMRCNHGWDLTELKDESPAG
jgi:hypothetical protein